MISSGPTSVEPLAWAIPERAPLVLPRRPRLESWDAAGTSSQLELEEFLDVAQETVAPQLADLQGDDLSIRLDVGLPNTTDPLYEADVDNYLFPILDRRRVAAERVVSAWCTKGRSEASLVRVDRARAEVIASGWNVIPCRTAAAPGSTEWKLEINRTVAERASQAIPPGPVGLQLIFCAVDPRRWPELWKPAIDALEPLLGSAYINRRWYPHDGRIVRLGLHRIVEAPLDTGAVIVCSRPASLRWPELRWFAEMGAGERGRYLDDHVARAAPRYWAGRDGEPVQGITILVTLEQFNEARSAGQIIVRKGDADRPRIHHRADICAGLKPEWFRPNRYFAVESGDLARRCWPTATPCGLCGFE